MDSRDVEFNRPSRAPRLRTNQPPSNEPRRHPRVGGNPIKPTESIEDNSTATESVISFFTVTPEDVDQVTFNVRKIIIDPDNPQEWTSIIVSKTRTTEITNPDGIKKIDMVDETPPIVISQKLLDQSIVKVEDRMRKIAETEQFGSARYVQEQNLRERMLDTYRYASAAS